MEGKYIYGIFTTEDGTAGDGLSPGYSNPVYTVIHQGLGCIARDYSGPELASLAKEEIIRHLLAHQEVIEHIMKRHTVLPVKFGTLLASMAELYQLLSQGQRQFTEALEWVQDKVEVEVAATWDLGRVLQEIGNAQEITQAKAALTNSSRPPAIEERIHLGQMVKAFMDKRRDSYRRQMLDLLMPVAVEAQSNPLVSEELVMNEAFLVDSAKQDELEQRVRQLNDILANQIDFRIIGPLPPYSFATVEVSRLKPGEATQARELLGLGDTCSELEVRRAYRWAAAQTLKQKEGPAETRLTKLRLATDLLIACCRGQANQESGLLIRIRRPRGGEGHYLPISQREGVLAGVPHG